MSRRSNTDVLEPEDTEVSNTEAPAEEITKEAAPEGESPRDTSGDTEHTDGEVQVSLEPFELAAQTAVTQRNDQGDLPDGAMDPVLEQYRQLPGTKDRNRAKGYLKDQMKAAMEGMDLPLAKAFYTLQESMTTTQAKKETERKPADPLAVWKHNLLTSLIAYGELAGAGKPDEGNVEEIQQVAGASETLAEINAYRTWLDTEVEDGAERPEQPKVRAEVIHAFRIVRGAKRRGVGTGGGERAPHDGPRRQLGKHIEEAFANVESGTFLSVADIRKFKSEEYGDEEPSAGAISARLFPPKGECTIEGIRPGTGGEKGTKGAYKL